MPSSYPDEIRHDLARQGIDPDGVSGRWLLRLLAHGEAGGGPAAPAEPRLVPSTKRRRPVSRPGAGRRRD
jgi:hypothetical protein